MKYFQFFPSVLALIAANVIPFVWMIYGSASPANFLFLYWLETWVIGFYNFFKIHKAAGIITLPEENLMKSQAFGQHVARVSRESIIKVFLIQYSFVVTFLGILLLGVIVPVFFSQGQGYTTRLLSAFPTKEAMPGFILSLLSFLASHGFSYAVNFIGKKEYLKVSPARQMLAPYDRIIAMYFVLMVVPAVFSQFREAGVETGIGPLAVAALIIMKLVADAASHVKEHMVIMQIGPEDYKETPS